MELLVARNPNLDSSLPYLLWVPLEGGLVFRTKGTWPRTSALYCHAVGIDEWPAEPEIVERVALRACARRGAAIDVVCDRGREQRSQIVFTRARGREVVFWQSPRTRKQARPDVRLRPRAPKGSRTWRSSSTVTSVIRTRSPHSKHARCVAACRVATMRLPYRGRSSRQSSGNRWPISCRA